MTSSRCRGVWILAVAAVLACGDTPSEDDGDSASSTGDGSTDGSASGSPTTIDPSESGTLSSSSTTASTSDGSTSGDDESTGSTTTTDDTSTDDGTDGAETSTDSTGAPPNQACIDGCMVEFACQDTCECDTMWRSEASCVAWCEANLEKAALFSPFCHDAWEALSACFATLTCEQFHEYNNPTMLPYPCSNEAESLAFECEGQ